jgi:hypothetical protein
VDVEVAQPCPRPLFCLDNCGVSQHHRLHLLSAQPSHAAALLPACALRPPSRSTPQTSSSTNWQPFALLLVSATPRACLKTAHVIMDTENAMRMWAQVICGRHCCSSSSTEGICWGGFWQGQARTGTSHCQLQCCCAMLWEESWWLRVCCCAES